MWRAILDSKPAPSYADLRVRVLGFATAFTLLVIVIALIGFFELRENALRAAERRAQSYSHILSAHLDRVVSAIDARLTQLALQSPRLGGPSGPDGPWQMVLDAQKAGNTTVGSLSIIDARGDIRHSTIPGLVGVHRGDRFIVRSLADPTRPDLQSDTPLRSMAGSMMLPFGRRLTGPDGALQGAAIATFTPDPLRNFYRSVDTEGGLLRLVHSTGALVMSEPESGVETAAPDDPVLRAYRSGLNSGVFVQPLAPSSPSMITAFTAVGGTGLLVSVSLNEARALQSWRADASASVAMMLGVLVAFWAAVLAMLSQLRAREAVEVALGEQRRRFADTQRLESLGQLTGGVAHDFNNLLTVIINAADGLLPRVAPEHRPRLQAILHASDNGAALVQQLLAFSRRQTLTLAPVDVNAVAKAMEDMVHRTLGARVEAAFVLAPNLWRAHADRAQIESALLNLVINARDAMPEGGRLTVETHNAHLDDDYAAVNADVAPGDYVALTITDTGAGMPADIIERAVEPFFTTKEVGKGSGLGLSMIYGFAKQSKGHLKIYSEVGRGTTVRLYLPRQLDDSEREAMVRVAGSDRGGSETILVVEDDPRVLGLAAAALRGRGYTVLEAVNGDAGLLVLQGETHIDLLLTDIVMPGTLTGSELGERAVVLRPGIKVLFTSGYADAAIMRNGMMKTGARFLSKPYRGPQLAAEVRSLLDG